MKIDIPEWAVVVIAEVFKNPHANWDDAGCKSIRAIKERFAKLAYNTRSERARRARYARAVRVVYVKEQP